MKKFLLLIIVLALGLVSCTMSIEGKGSLIVSNYSEDSDLDIVGVYVKEDGAVGFTLVYSGVIADTKSYFIELDPGNYAIKIAVKNNSRGGKTNYYETGYNIYKEITLKKSASVIFDGKGIFFE